MRIVFWLLTIPWFFFDACSAYAQVIHTLTKVISNTPTITTGAYAAGDLIGSKLTLANATFPGIFSGKVQSVVLTDLDAESADIDVVFFSSDPSATTFTNDSALDIADADLPKVICRVSVIGTNYAAFVDNSAATVVNVGCPFETANPSVTLYAALVAREAVTYTGTTDLTLRVGIEQD
jgi:hypothetical protein